MKTKRQLWGVELILEGHGPYEATLGLPKNTPPSIKLRREKLVWISDAMVPQRDEEGWQLYEVTDKPELGLTGIPKYNEDGTPMMKLGKPLFTRRTATFNKARNEIKRKKRAWLAKNKGPASTLTDSDRRRIQVVLAQRAARRLAIAENVKLIAQGQRKVA